MSINSSSIINRPITPADLFKKFNVKHFVPKFLPIESTESRYTALELAVLQGRDPITRKRLTNAVIVLPCTHRFNKETLDSIQTITKDHFYKASEGSNCPQCKDPIIGYYIDHVTRQNVKELLEKTVKDRNILDIPLEPQEKWQGIKPDYPDGLRGEFKENEFIKKENKYLQNEIKFSFDSQNDSIINSFYIIFSQNYKDCLCIKFRPNEGFEDYLWKAHNIFLDDSQKLRCCIKFDELIEVRKWWNLIVKHNNIPEHYQTEIKQLLSKCREGKSKEVIYD